MEKEIKFRAKRIDNGEWAYGYLFEDIAFTRRISYIIEGGFVPAISMPSSRFVEVKSETICCSTGEKDRNNFDVFGGDIINVFMEDGKIYQRNKNRKIIFYAGSFGYIDNSKRFVALSSLDYYVLQIEVVGNIHDNPELLIDKK